MDLSIIIPCYNHGRLIQDAIDSVLQCKNILYEIIIINDGSTDEFTKTKIKELHDQGYKVISHDNHGLGYTRNAGIRNALGKYILPLDADNMIKPEYIYESIKILDNDKADIVYGDPIFFGENIPIRKFQAKEFNITELFFGNYIDACAIYRKKVWLEVGGYEENMPFQGHEDWEFWINASSKGFKFYHIDEGLYYYRVLNNSLAANLKHDKDNLNHNYILKKHFELFTKTMITNYTYGKMYQRDLQMPLRASLKYLVRFFKSSKY